MQNAHYASLEAYVDALADALRTEYEAIVAAGFVLQIDAPDLAMERHTLFADRPLAEFLAFVDHVVAALNRALAGIPPDRVRLHVCWGNYEGPHTLDVALEEILPRVLAARAGALVLSMANPRHAHEHKVLARRGLPAEDGARRGRDRHDDQLRRAPRGDRRPPRAAPRAPSATRTASSPAPTAASAPPRASARSRRRSCG